MLVAVCVGVAPGRGVALGREVAVGAGVVGEGDGETVSVNSGDDVTETTAGAQALNTSARKRSKTGLANMINRSISYHQLHAAIGALALLFANSRQPHL